MAKAKLASGATDDLVGPNQGEAIGGDRPPADPTPREEAKTMDIGVEDDGRDFKLHSNDYL